MIKEKIVNKENKITKSKFITTSVISIILIIIIAVIFGVTAVNNTKKDNASIRINEIEERLEKITEETNSLNKQMIDIDIFSDQYTEISKKQKELSIEKNELIIEQQELINKYFETTSKRTSIDTISGMFAIQKLFFIAFFIIFIMIFVITIIRIIKGLKTMDLDSEIIQNENKHRLFSPKYKSLRCPNCHAIIKGNKELEICEYCGASLVKVYEKNTK